MSAERNFSPDEYELLSAYLDDMLTEAERTALEARLANDDALRAELESLRNTVSLIKSLPVLKAPRNFTLTPEMVKSKTEPSSPSMVKSRTEPSSPNMSKSRTEPGRVIRFPISTAMSAAASFVFIVIGLLLLTSGQILPTAAPPPINRGAENMDVAMQQEQREMMPSSAQIITEETAEQEAPDMDAVSQRAMPTATLTSATTGMMPMPTLTLSVMMTQSANQPQMPAPMVADMTATMSAESFAESAPVMAFSPTLQVVPEVMNLPPVNDVAQDVAEEAMTDITTMSMVTSPEITPVEGVIEIMGNAIPPTDNENTVYYDNQQGGVTALVITPTPDFIIFNTTSDNTNTAPINITMIVGIALIVIGMIVFGVTLWRWRKG